MAYLRDAEGYAGLEGQGCGAGCACGKCSGARSGLAEYYYEGEGRDEPRRPAASSEALGEAAPQPAAPAGSPLTRVADASVPPFRAVCRIVARQDDKGFSVGSGLLVGPYHVLTCAHVIFPPQAPGTREIVVHPGQNGPDDPATSFKANGWAVSPRWRANDCTTFGEDYGIIRLPVQHGFVPLIPFKALDLLQALVTMVGYPSTREPAARHMFQSSGQVLGAIRIRRCTMTSVDGTLVPSIAPGDSLVGHNLQSEPSLSGAPLLFTKDTRRVAALHAGVVANGRLRKAIVINATVHAQIMDWMRRTLAPLPR
jgi:hypothetical protein